MQPKDTYKNKSRVYFEMTVDADYDVLCSHSLDALQGRADGWCNPVPISQTPLKYELISYFSLLGGSIKIGELKLKKNGDKKSKIVFSKLGFRLSLNQEEIEMINNRLGEVIDGYFAYLKLEHIEFTLPGEKPRHPKRKKEKEIPRPKYSAVYRKWLEVFDLYRNITGLDFTAEPIEPYIVKNRIGKYYPGHLPNGEDFLRKIFRYAAQQTEKGNNIPTMFEFDSNTE